MTLEELTYDQNALDAFSVVPNMTLFDVQDNPRYTSNLGTRWQYFHSALGYIISKSRPGCNEHIAVHDMVVVSGPHL